VRFFLKNSRRRRYGTDRANNFFHDDHPYRRRVVRREALGRLVLNFTIMKKHTPCMIPVPCGKCGGSLVKTGRNMILCEKCHRKDVVKILNPAIEAMPGKAMVALWNKTPPGTHPFFQVTSLCRNFVRRLKKLGLWDRCKSF